MRTLNARTEMNDNKMLITILFYDVFFLFSSIKTENNNLNGHSGPWIDCWSKWKSEKMRIKRGAYETFKHISQLNWKQWQFQKPETHQQKKTYCDDSEITARLSTSIAYVQVAQPTSQQIKYS